ncbi:uncharacterized protein [Hetaerina americana]|uniref:uncharacterized protein n=1 Tax=Hetaerina americana TaxID=62018 RepID=UPI003A7F3540
MHFWIDKRSQACGGAPPGRLRGPPIPPHRRHQAHGLFRSGRSAIPRRSIAKPPPHRPRSRLNAPPPPGGGRAMPPPHHHEAVIPPLEHPPNISLSRQSESFSPPVPLGHTGLDSDLVAVRNAECAHAPSSRPPPPHVFGEELASDGSQSGGGAIPPGSVRKLHCGMWAGFAMAVFFVGGTKVYFDRQGSGVEMLVFCAMLLLFLLAGCIVSICRSRGDRQLAQQYLEAFQNQNRPVDTIHQTESAQRANRPDAGPAVVQPPTNAAAVPTECSLPRQDGGPPPPYHIAILLPQPPRSLPPTPPPSYAKATT